MNFLSNNDPFLAVISSFQRADEDSNCGVNLLLGLLAKIKCSVVCSASLLQGSIQDLRRLCCAHVEFVLLRCSEPTCANER